MDQQEGAEPDAGKVVDDAEEQLKVGQEEAEEAEEWVEE